MDLVYFARGGGLVAFLLSTHFASAQGTITVLNTGSGQPLVSAVRPLLVDGGGVQPRLLFNLGFATDETATPGAFLDSFTVTIQDSNQVFTTIYITADAAGFVVAPPTPGTVVIDPATISKDPLDYPSLNPVLLNRRAFVVIAPIPAQFVGSYINVYFDLFDNLIQAVNMIGSLFYGTILGIFFTAFFLKKVGGKAVFWAAVATQAVIAYLFFFVSRDPFLWYNPLGCGLVMGLSLIFQQTLFTIRLTTR